MENPINIVCARAAGGSPHNVLLKVIAVEPLDRRVRKTVDESQVTGDSGFLDATVVIRREELHPRLFGASAGEATLSALTNAVKTEIVLTQTPERWRDWLALRAAPTAHPDMQICARLFCEEAERLGVLI